MNMCIPTNAWSLESVLKPTTALRWSGLCATARAPLRHVQPLQRSAVPPILEPATPKRPAHYLWAVLIARIYEVFPLLCPNCGGQMRLFMDL